jgi:hypothetical protein
MQKVKKIEIQLDNIRSEDVLTRAMVYQSVHTGNLVIDASNVPLHSDVLDASTENPTVFFGFNADDNTLKRSGVQDFGHTENTVYDIHYWNYPLNDERTRSAKLSGGMTIGMAPYKRGYESIRDKIDSLGRKW